MNTFSFVNRLLIIGLLSLFLSACGSSGDDTSAGIGGTGITQGEVTAFGSIFVNGIEFDTNQSQFDIDGDTTATESGLSIGMVVSVSGKIDDNGLTGRADQVVYNDDIQGPITAITTVSDSQKTLSIFDKTVLIDEAKTRFNGTNFDNIDVNDIVEVSGFNSSANTISASFVRKIGEYPSAKTIQLKGTITSLATNSFKLGGITIEIDNQTNIETPNGILSDGQSVDVKGKLQSLTTVLATKVALEENKFEEGTEVNLQGIISDFNSSSDFMVSDQAVNASGASLSPTSLTLTDGVNVEVEGEIVNGILVAEKIELREGKIRIKGFISNIDLANQRFTYTFTNASNTISVNTDNQTSFEDKVDRTPNYSINQLAINDFIEIEGIDTGNEILASKVKKIKLKDSEVKGQLQAFDQVNRKITILDVEFEYSISATLPTPLPQVGDTVKIKDKQPADGNIDEIELDD